MRISDLSSDVCSSDLKGLDGDIWKTRIAEPAPPNGYLRWHGDEAAQKAVYANRSRLKSAVGRKAMRKRGEMVERSFAHVLDRGGMRRAWLRGRENVHKRYLRSEEHTSELQSLMRISYAVFCLKKKNTKKKYKLT